jgi:transcriptional regulator with XRE-family HTH domain
MTPFKHIRKFVLAATTGQMAEICGVSQGTISKWENGLHSPDLAAITRVRDHVKASGKEWDDSWIFEVPTAAPTSSTTQSVG